MPSRFSLAMFGLVVCSIAKAQSPFASLHWEANDGTGWTRAQLQTNRQTVQIRLVANWGAIGTYAFGGTSFDAVIHVSNQNDQALNLLRVGTFAFDQQTIAATHVGNMIKIDDALDSDVAGAGPLWVQCGQTNGAFGEFVDESNPATIFSFTLAMADEQGTREVSSIHQLIDATGANARLWGSPTRRVAAPVFAVSITYIPAPSALAFLASASILLRRRR